MNESSSSASPWVVSTSSATFARDVLDVSRERTGPQNAYEISFPQGCIWGIMGCAAAFGITLVVERTRGTLVRLRMAPISA